MGKLKGIPAILSPDLLYLLASTGHGDEIVLGDINFPVKSICKSGPTEYRADGLNIVDLLDAMLQLMPLDSYDFTPATVMELLPEDSHLDPVYEARVAQYREIVKKHENRKVQIARLNRDYFYERAKKAYAVIQTGDMAPYANVIIKRGVINE